MSGLKPITVNTAPEADPHIYAEDDAAIYQSIFGSDGVMTIGQQCESQVISNNKVRVKDGVIVVGGHVARIPYGEYIDCEIANGQSGVNRNDIIIGKFVTTGSGGIDTFTCEVKQGVAGSSASDPALTQNDIYAGGKIREMPLYRVKIEGLSIVAVEQMFDLIPTIPDLEEQIADLNSKIYSKKVLWTHSGMFLNAGQTINLSEKLSDQKHGIVVVLSRYESGASQNYGYCTYFIPKECLDFGPESPAFDIPLSKYVGSSITNGSKYIYVSDDKITGAATNSTSPNNGWVFRYVIGV